MNLTFAVETFVKNFLDGFFRRFQRVFSPSFAIVTSQDDDLALLTAQCGKMRNFDNDRSA